MFFREIRSKTMLFWCGHNKSFPEYGVLQPIRDNQFKFLLLSQPRNLQALYTDRLHVLPSDTVTEGGLSPLTSTADTTLATALWISWLFDCCLGYQPQVLTSRCPRLALFVRSFFVITDAGICSNRLFHLLCYRIMYIIIISTYSWTIYL